MEQTSGSPIFHESTDNKSLEVTDYFAEDMSCSSTEELSHGLGSLPTEEWEEWMKWDGTTSSVLTPQQSCREFCVTANSDKPSQPTDTRKFASACGSSETFKWPEVQLDSRKRKSLEEHIKTSRVGEVCDSSEPQLTKRSHTIIEKRYRNNLNQKITALRESVPSLRADSEALDLGGLVPASKLNKATILSKAIEYIQYLEKRNSSLEKENLHLRRYNNHVEEKDCHEPNDPHQKPPKSRNEKRSSQAEDAPLIDSTSLPSTKAPEGMIRVPDAIRNLRSSAPQDHYADRFQNRDEPNFIFFDTASTGQQGSSRGRLVGKVMIGSLAGLMIMEGFSEDEESGNAPGGRGLWALPSLPFRSLNWPWLTWWSGVSFPAFAPYVSPLCKLFLVVLGLAFALFLYLFSSRPRPSKKMIAVASAVAPSLASPIEVRQKAWLTSIQTVWVPRHQMFPELLALHLEALRYVLRNLIGWSGYSWLTGGTQEDEVARVRAWDIAIDAQLTGGDSELSKSRLVLTILASGTLPSTSARLMLKALHIRILLWETSKSCWSIWSILHKAAAQLARQQWLLARKIYEMPDPLNSRLPEDREALPEHLAELLKLDSDELFTKSVVQRAYNLAWNRPTGEDAEDEDVGMDIVVEDSAIRSPLDALAAWASGSILRQTLISWYENGGTFGTSHQQQIEVALKIAPPASSAFVRALAAKAVFFEDDRRNNITKLLKDLLPPKPSVASETASLASESALVDSCIPERVRNDVRAAMQCAAALGLLASRNRKARAAYSAVDLLAMIYVNANSLSLLGFAATHQLLLVLAKEQSNGELTGRLNYIKAELRIWINGPVPKENGLDVHACKTISAALDTVIVQSKPIALRRFSEISNDTGYESMSDRVEEC